MDSSGHDEYIIPVTLVCVLQYIAGTLFGLKNGRRAEKARALSLCHQTIQQGHNSGTLRWVWNSIADDRRTLLPYEKFFPPEPDKPDGRGQVSSVQETASPQE